MANIRVPTTSKVITMLDERGLLKLVLDKDLTTPPGSPSEGDRYIVGPSATGDWSGHDNEIAEWDGSQWVFGPTLTEGLIVYVADEDKIYTYNGTSWSYTSGEGDMLKSTYDTDEDGIVDKAETLDDGVGNSVTAAQVKNVVDNFDSKADKVSGATAGNIASLDSNGNLQDSGIASTNVFDKSADDLDAVNDGTTYGRVLQSELTSGAVNRLNDGTNTVTAAQAKKAYDTRALYDASTDEIVFVDPDNL